jgi:hypothetical protein
VALGRPFLADIEVAAFYPPHGLYALLEPHLALTLLLVAHTALLLVGMLRLAGPLGIRDSLAWLVAVAFASSGVVFGIFHAGQIPYGSAVCWLPLLLWLALRLQDDFTLRRLALLTLGLTLQFLCGHPQAAWLTWLGLGLFLVGRAVRLPLDLRPMGTGLGGLAVALAGAALVAACQLLPFLELVGQGNRAVPSAAFSSAGALRPTDWATLALPAWPGSALSLGADFYLGATLTLAGLAGLSRLSEVNVRGLALMASTAFLFSLGQRTPAWPFFYHALPGVSSFRFPGRAGLLVTLALLLAAGSFLSERRRRPAGLAVVSLAGVASAAGALFWQRALPASKPPAAWLWLGFVVLATAMVFVWHLRCSATHPAGWPLLGLVVGLVFVETAVTVSVHKPFRRTISQYPGERFLAGALNERGLRDAAGTPPRVMVPFPVIRDNSGMAFGFSNISGYGSLTLRPVWIYVHESIGLGVPEDENTYPSFEIYRLGPFAHPQGGVVIGLDEGTMRLVTNPTPAPRVWLASRTESVADLHAAAARLRNGQSRDVATFVGAAPELLPYPPSSPGAGARITSFRAERIEIEADTNRRSVLVLAEAWYPGWSATVNGAPAVCRAVNGWMRGVVVPAGRSRVVLTYRSRWLGVGAALSAAASLLLLVLLFGPARRRAAAVDLPPHEAPRLM